VTGHVLGKGARVQRTSGRLRAAGELFGLLKHIVGN